MNLIPNPQIINAGTGEFLLRHCHRITLDSSCGPELLDTARQLQQQIREISGMESVVDRRTARQHRHEGIRLGLDPALGREEYRLTVAENGVDICGGSAAGLHWGVQTLRQLVRQYGMLLPCLEIRDWPDLQARGLFYDVTRGRIPTLEYLKALADKCSFYKLNQLHLYVEHCYLFDGISETVRDDTPLTAQDILELDAYCRKRHVELVPSIATLGHLYKVLRGKQYGHLSELEEGDREFSFYGRMEHHTLDVTQEESMELVLRMIGEYASLFTSRLFNINGDEVFDLGKGRGKQRAQEIGSHQMYVDWIKKIAQHVKDLGFRPMFWGDVIIEDPEKINQLPRDIICMNWDYEPDFREDHAQKLAATGVAQYLCPGLQGWNNMINPFPRAYENLKKMATLAHKYHGEGFLVTEWGDYGHMADPESTASLIPYAGGMGWNKAIPAQEELDRDISVVTYGDPTGKIMSLLNLLSRQTVMTWGDAVVYSEISRGRMPEHDLKEYHDYYGTRIRENLGCWDQKQQAIRDCQRQMSRMLPGIREAKRLKAYFLMSDGQMLLNTFARFIYGEKPDCRELAVQLEEWFLEYKDLWRQTSRESELFRLGEVIFWMADTLRENS